MTVPILDNLGRIRDRWRGRMAFICAPGPSLVDVDPAALAGHVIIACNLAVVHFRERADVFFHCDSAVPMCRFWPMLDEWGCEVPLNWYFRARAYPDPLPRRSWWYDRKWDASLEERWTMRPDDTRLVAGQQTCVSVAVHLAFVAGCSPIVLLGVDCAFAADGRRYFLPPEGAIYWLAGSVEHYHSETIHTDETTFRADTASDWVMLQRHNPDVSILNASGGVLDVFPRVTLADVLARYADRRETS